MNRNTSLAKSQEFPKDEGKGLPGLDNIDFESAEDPTLDKIDFESKSIDFESEEPIQKSLVTGGEPPGIYMPKERTLFDKFKSLITDPGIDKDRAANIVTLSETYGLSPSQAEKHYDELKGFVFEGTYPTSRDVAGGLMGAAVTAGVVFNPVATAIGVGTFMGLDELENYIISKYEEDPYHFQEGKGISDLLKAHGLSKDAIDMLDFMWKIPVAGGTTKFSRGIFGAITSRIKGQRAKARFINKVVDDVKNEGTTPDEAALKNAEEFGIDKDQLLKAQKDKEAKGDLASEEVENPLEITRPTDAIPTYTFTSQKGNYYEKIGERWYDGKGREVTNNYVVKAAEKRKVKFEENEAAVEERVVKDIEEKTGKRIEEVTKEEIDKYYSEEEEIVKPVTEKKVEVKVEAEGDKYNKAVDDLINEKNKLMDQRADEKGIVRGLPQRGSLEETMTAVTSPSYNLEQSIEGIKSAIKHGRDDIANLIIEKAKRFYPEDAKQLENLYKLQKEELTDVKVEKPVVEEPIAEEPITFQGEKSPFFQNKVKTAAQRKLWKEKGDKINDSPEMLTQKLINDVNRWYHGDKDVDIAKTRGFLDALKDNADDFLDFIDSNGDAYFIRGKDHLKWKETVTEAADWARGLDNLKFKKSGGPQLNVMIPLEEVPKAVSKFWEDFKQSIIPLSNLFRNKKVWKETGFWLGQDGFWRYEIGKEDIKIKPEEIKRSIDPTKRDSLPTNLTDILDAPKLFEAIPRLKGTRVVEIPTMKGYLGTYDRVKNYIDIRDITDKSTLHHEIQHAINDAVGSEFKGINVSKAGDKREYMKDPGEMESRLTEKRMEMSAEDRAKTPPWETLDNMLYDEGFKGEDYWTVGTKLYSGIPLDKARGIFDRLKRKPKPTPKPSEPFSVKSRAKEVVLERRANLNLANYETNKFINSIEQRLNLDQRESMPFVIEGTDVPKELGRPDLQKVINKDKELLKGIATEVKEHFNEGWQKIKKHVPDLSVKQIEDYVTHLWDVPKHKRAEAVSWFQTQNRFLEKRFIDTYKEGIEKGFRPKVLDISEIIRIHDAVGNRAIENTRYINALLKLKDQGIYLIQRTGTAPMEWIEVDYPALTRRIPLPKKVAGKKGEFIKELKVRVHPDLVRPLKAIFEQRFDHPVISAYEALNGILKKSMLTVSLFHHGALGETGVALIGPRKTANIMFNPVKIYNALAKGEYDIFTKEAIARDSIEHGVQYGATADIPVSKIQGYLNDLAKGSENIVMVNRITKALKGINSVWDKALWNYLHDTLKLYGYESMVGKLDPNMGTAATKMAKREIGQLVNDTFGGQNWDALMMTPKEVQMMTWSLLSADWTFSTTRQALAPTGIGKVYKESADVRKKMSAMFWARAAIYFGIGINGLNVLFRNWDMKENPQYYRDKNLTLIDKTMMGNTIGKKTKLFVGRYKDGSERYLRWGKQFIDFYELIASPIDKIGGKAAPVPQLLSEAFTGHSLSGFKNDDVYGKKGFESAYGIFKTVAKAPIPLALRRMMNDNVEFKPTDVFMPSSKGMSRYRALEYFKKAIVDQDEDLLRETYEGSLRNNLPAYTLFNGALAWTENEIMADVNKNVEDIKDAEAKLNAASSAYDKRRYGIVLRKLQKEKADKEAGLRLIKTAIERSRIYNELSSDVPKLHRNR